MDDISLIRSDLISIVRNNRMPINTKKILIKRGLIAINTFIELKPNKIYNQKKRKINNILSMLPSIKYNVDLKKILTTKLINYLTNFKNFPDINIKSFIYKKEDDKDEGSEISSDEEHEKQKNIVELLNKCYSINTDNKTVLKESVNSKESKEFVNSDESDSETEQETDEELDTDDEETNEETDEELDTDDEDELDRTVNNLMEDLSDKDKIKLIMKLTKYKLEHEYKMEAEKNRNMERMEELSLKRLKIKNKYKLKKLENKN